MTPETMARAQLLEKGSEAELLHKRIGDVAQRLIEANGEGLAGAGHGQHSQARQNGRSGFRQRD